MNWIDVTKKTPPQNTPVLFYSRDLDAHLVGYWSEYDNCMVQYPDDREGWKWSVSKWAFIDKSDSPTCTANERKFLDEIREKGKYNKYCNTVEIGETVIHNKDFQWALIEELVNE